MSSQRERRRKERFQKKLKHPKRRGQKPVISRHNQRAFERVSNANTANKA